MRIFNGTPHQINIIENYEYDPVIRKYTSISPRFLESIPSHGILNAKIETVPLGTLGKIPLYKKSTNGFDPLPDGYDMYIVSLLYATAHGPADNLYTVADPIYGRDGRTVLGCRGLSSTSGNLKRQIPEDYSEQFLLNVEDRKAVIHDMGFSLVSKSWTRPLAKWIGQRKCLEVMAGSGAITYALKEEGVDIIATDNFSWKTKFAQWTEVKKIDAIDAIYGYGKDISVLIMSFPYMDNTAFKILKAMRAVNKDCVLVYIGEPIGGCTADEEFFVAAEEIEDSSFEEVKDGYRRWDAMYDSITLLR